MPAATLVMVVLLGRGVAALPGGDAGLVALGVGQDPEGGGLGVVDEPAAGGQGGLDAALGLVVGDRDVEVDPVALEARGVHLLEPDRRGLADGVDQGVLGPGAPGLVG